MDKSAPGFDEVNRDLPSRSQRRAPRLSRLCQLLALIVRENSKGLGRFVCGFVGGIADLMAFDATRADGLLSHRRLGWAEKTALALAAIALSVGAAAWITDPNQTAFASAALPGNSDRNSSFDDRFFPASATASPADEPALQPLDRFALAVAQIKVQTTRIVLDRQLMSRESSVGLVEAKVDEAKAITAADTIPLPRSRPAAADLEARPTNNTARPEDRTLLQKLSDLLPGRITLASLAPDGGLFHRGPDLASLGYDGLTAVYDISAHTVYLPNGSSLEAHSGMGNLRDDPEHVSVPNAGATPPAAYELKPRETLFHGVQALRMIPAEGSDTAGRAGLLAHSFMLGPNGDSNGCVSIKEYDRFLKAFNDGKINRLVVVPSLSGGRLALQNPFSRS